jgi:tRNA nucleotidyltransferase (CCA-adding enzyme)
MARTRVDEIRKFVSHYLTKLRDIRTDISGEDLQAMGGHPGPCFGKVLNHVLAAKLDGAAHSRKEQLELAHSMLRRYNYGRDEQQ